MLPSSPETQPSQLGLPNPLFNVSTNRHYDQPLPLQISNVHPMTTCSKKGIHHP